MMTASEVTWFHLSDVHFKVGDRYDRDIVLKALLQSVPRLKPKKVDAIFFSGDVAFSGQADEYKHATEFFDNLLEALDIEKRYLFVVPGNHDVDRSKSSGLIRTLNSEEESNDYFNGTAPKVHIQKKMSAFKTWHDHYFEDIREFPENSTCVPPERLSVGGTKLSVFRINTAIFSHDQYDQGHLWIGKRNIDEAISISGYEYNDEEIGVAILHHPTEWLNEGEQSKIVSRLREKFDYILNGHLHKTEGDSTVGTNGAAIHLAAGAAYQGSNWPNRAMFITATKASVLIHPIRYEREPEAWTMDPSVFPHNANGSGRLENPKVKALESNSATEAVNITAQTPAGLQPVTEPMRERQEEFERGLFTAPGGEHLYATPRLATRSQLSVVAGNEDCEFVSLAEILSSKSSYLVEARSEYGATTICKRLRLDSAIGGQVKCAYLDARKLPNYRAKLKGAMPTDLGAKANNVAIIDNYNPQSDEKFLAELRSLDLFDRYIIFVRPNLLPSDPVAVPADFSYRRLFLWGIDRGGIRELAKRIFDSADDNFISVIVNKVYSDLLALCIPLTPSNVIMYLRVLGKEDEFLPFNRVDIVARYLTEALSKPSEAYVDTFNARAKMDVISALCFKLFEEERATFTDSYWSRFCADYKVDKLVDFPEQSLLADLELNRVIERWGTNLSFRYGFFFSFLVGRHIAGRQTYLEGFLKRDDRNSLQGIMEVISGILNDNTVVVETLIADLECGLVEFATKYISQDFDPLASAKWPDAEDEDQKLWGPVQRQIEAGPAAPKEVDLFKTSLSLEARTEDQQVRFRALKTLEIALFANSTSLTTAMRNVGSIDGTLKKRAVMAVLNASIIMLQIGVILSPKIAESGYYFWGGLAFVGFPSAKMDGEDDNRRISRVVMAMPPSIMIKVADELGSQKLGEVFKALFGSNEKRTFADFLLFGCLISSRPKEWFLIAGKFIDAVGKNDFYLLSILLMLMHMHKYEVALSQEKERLARLIAHVRAKREYGKESPGNKAISAMYRSLNESNSIDGTG
jgi:predicted phosphodiesterase